MSSGIGLFTDKGRCHPFWQEFLRCKSTSDDPRKECTDFIDDYMECLHHTKEVRIQFIVIHYKLSIEGKDDCHYSTIRGTEEKP